jgi:DNA polymerase-3 subunit alpha
MSSSRKPTKFVSIHNHTGFSPFDGLGYPDEHFQAAMNNGIVAHAITEHGSMNSYAHAQLWAEKWNKENPGKPFKYIPGVESYFHPDLKQWARDKAQAEQAASDKKEAAKLAKKQEKYQTKIIAVTDKDDETEDFEMTNALTVENEEESKSTKHFNPVKRRHHLVLLPKNQEGLLKIFGLVSKSYLQGFYSFPRIDAAMLKEAGKDGNIIASSACLAGLPAFNIFQELQQYKFDDLNSGLLNDKVMLEKAVTAVGNCYDLMTDTLGKDNYYLELQFNRLGAQNLINRAMLEFADRNGLKDKLVVTCDAHYASAELWKDRELYKRLGFMNYRAIDADSLPKSKDELKCELYPKNADQVWEEYLRAKEGTDFYDDEVIADAIERSHHIAFNVIGEVPPDRSPKFPNERLVPKDRSPIQHLTKLCLEGLTKRGRDKDPLYIARLKEELGVIKTMKNADYFISYQKIMELARKVCLVGPARGSGGGSLVAYVLYITDLDPLKWDLPFARFLSVYRKGAPDIDTDLSNRDKVLDQLRDFFGFENVVPISNYNTFKLKTLVKDISKFYGIDFNEANDATRTVEQEVRKAVTKHGDDKNLFVLKYDDAMGYICEHKPEPPIEKKMICEGCSPKCTKPVSPSFQNFINKHLQVAESIKILFKQNRSLGRHAGGVLIADDLPNKMPLVASKGEPQSPWVEGVNFKHLEYIGNFIKYDLLGLETLRLIERTIELILMKAGNVKPTFDDVKLWYEQNLSPDVIDFDDQKVYEYVYHDARWAGIFQLTSSGAQRLFVKGKPKNIIDIATLTSIYRPGPLAAKVDSLYIKARGGEDYVWGDPRIGEILKKTNGLIIFQEQVMELAEKCAGFPKEQCDEVRRNIMKRSIEGGAKQAAAAKETRDSFVEGCVKNSYDRAVANDLYDKILYFAGYGFNKSHAVAYAIDSYWCAWLMTYYEEEWLCSYLESMSGTPDKRETAFGEVKALGYEFVPIDINHANASWTIIEGKKFMPSFMSCKGVGVSAIEEITQNRPYTSIEHMLWDIQLDDVTGELKEAKWKHSKFNKKALETLIKIGALGSLDAIGEGKIFSSYRHMHHVLVENSDKIKKTSKRDPGVGLKNFYELARTTRDEYPEWTRSEMVANQVELLGSFDVSSLVDEEMATKLATRGIRPIDELETGEKDIVWLVAQSVTKKVTKNKKTYGLIEALGPSGRVIKLNVWGWNETPIQPFTMYVAEVEKNDYGCSTTQWKLKKLGVDK